MMLDPCHSASGGHWQAVEKVFAALSPSVISAAGKEG
jgi:hypothetical protein